MHIRHERAAEGYPVLLFALRIHAHHNCFKQISLAKTFLADSSCRHPLVCD